MRAARVLRAGVLVLALSSAAPTAALGGTVTCIGSATIGAPTNYASRAEGGVVIETWDFTGTHDLCLADSTVVTATMAGQAISVSRADGSTVLVVRETLSIPAGTLHAIVLARLTPSSFEATVHAYGGTGELAGVTGRGTTTPTSPNTFQSEVVYRYP